MTRPNPATRAAGSGRSWMKPSSAACWPGCSTKMNSSVPMASGPSRATTRTIPMSFNVGGQEFRVPYLPGESDTGMFGGNSNWRGPIWMPVNALIIRALLQYYALLRQRLHRGMPDRLRPADEPLSSRRGIARRLDQHVPEGQERPPARDTAASRSSRKTRTGATASSSTNTSMATTAPDSARVTRPGGPASSPVAMHLFATTTADQVLEFGKSAAVVEIEKPRKNSNACRTCRPSRKR